MLFINVAQVDRRAQLAFQEMTSEVHNREQKSLCLTYAMFCLFYFY
uniref:Uncharacterized protein n=1 Tax=Anguilla anguilla TaxID=7936 RepID=A0A0E9U0F5_ANGAN